MSSSGYPQIEFGYDDASDENDDSEEDDVSTSPGVQIPNEAAIQHTNLVSKNLIIYPARNPQVRWKASVIKLRANATRRIIN